MTDNDHLLRMQGTAYRYIQGLKDIYAGLSVRQLVEKARTSMDERGLVADYIQFNGDANLLRQYEAELSKLEASAQRQPSCTEEPQVHLRKRVFPE